MNSKPLTFYVIGSIGAALGIVVLFATAPNPAPNPAATVAKAAVSDSAEGAEGAE